jgi:hypothetical protein
MIDLIAAAWDWLKANAPGVTLYLAGVLTGLAIAWLLARANRGA